MEMAITVNLLLIKTPSSNCQIHSLLENTILSPAKPALQSEEGSRKTPSAALRKAGLGHNPCLGDCAHGWLESTLPWPDRDPKHTSQPCGTPFCRRACSGEARLVPEELISPCTTSGSVAGPAWGRSPCLGSHAGLPQGWCGGKAGWQNNADPTPGHIPPPTWPPFTPLVTSWQKGPWELW